MNHLFRTLRFFSSTTRMKRNKTAINPLPLIKSAIDTSSIDKSVFTNDFQKVMNFLNRISKVLEITIPKPEAIETTKNTSHLLYEVLAHNRIEIPEKYQFIFKKENIEIVKNLTFFGRAKSISEAKQRSLFHLAECLYASLNSAESFLPTIDQDPKKVLPFIKFRLTQDQKDKMKYVFEECTSFMNEISTEPVTGIIKQVSRRIESSVTPTESCLPVRRNTPMTGKLPIYRHYCEIIDSVENNQVTIVSATTGSGKTTQIPRFILHHFENEKPSIIVTQPRRVAAISLANRVAYEMDEKSVGNSVGYSVRFDSILPNPKIPNILFCTSGLLIKKLQMSSDETMFKCTHLILDEIHERDINTDILLLAVRRLLVNNKKMKVVIMSATLDADKFYNYFSECKELTVANPIKIETSTNFPVVSYHLEDVINVLRKKRMYPNYTCSPTRQFVEKELNGDEALPEIIPFELMSHLAKYLHESKPDGSILCFLPGWEDIVTVKNDLELILSRSSKPFKIYCIHSSAPPEVAQSIFHRNEGERKIILATNIAESSITIPDIAYVIDSGKQKINMYNPALRMNSLKTTWISKSNSIQRLGRVGRTQPGEYYLLCSVDRKLNATLPPEILRVGLEDVCLSIKGLGFEGNLKEIASELLDKPNRIALRDAVNRLIQLDALEAETENITNLGKILSSIPLNPSLGKALVLSHILGYSRDVLTLASGVGERVIKPTRFDDEKEIYMKFLRLLKSDFSDDHSLLLNLFNLFQSHELSRSFNNSELKFISNLALKRISKVRDSLNSQLNQLLPVKLEDDFNNENITRIFLLSAFYPDIALKMSRRNHYLLPGGLSAELQKESMQYTESLENILSEASENDSSTGKMNSTPKGQALVFEELFDAGHTLIVKSSLVDPVFCALFADNIAVLYKTIYVDNWIRINSDDSESLNLLLEARNLWKSLSRHCLKFNNSIALMKYRKLLECLSEIWDSQRNIEIK